MCTDSEQGDTHLSNTHFIEIGEYISFYDLFFFFVKMFDHMLTKNMKESFHF